MIIDVHTHAFPDFLAAKAMELLSEPFGDWQPARDGTVSSLLTSMDEAGVDCSFVANIATRPEQGPAILEWSRQIASARIIPLGSVHPLAADWEQQLEAIARAGLPGLKLHAQFQGFVVDDDRVLPLYERASQLGLFILFHAGFDISFPGDTSSSPERLARVRRLIPKLTMIAAHVGGWSAWQEALDHLVGLDVFLDTSYIHQVDEQQLELILQRHPRERLLFASDSPWLSQKKSLRFLLQLGLTPETFKLLLGDNAQHLHPSLKRWDARTIK